MLPPSLEAVNAAWDLDTPEEAWLVRLAMVSQAELDVGLGLHAMVLDVEMPAAPVRTPVLVGGSDEWRARWRRDWWERVVLHYPAAAHLAATAAGPVALSSQTNELFLSSMKVWERYARRLATRGYQLPQAATGAPPVDSRLYPETLYIGGLDRPGHAVVLCANLPSRDWKLERGLVRRWSLVAAHLGAALRLRRALAAAPLEPEAIVDPRGRVLHAQGEAAARASRDALAAGTVSREQALLARRRRSDDERLHAWRALHHGAWSLVEATESDGKRLLRAYRNVPRARASRTLSVRERQVIDFLAVGHSNKVIAYELGISTSSVSTHLKRAALKLGAASTLDLVRLARTL